jgi:hypothetical protein
MSNPRIRSFAAAALIAVATVPAIGQDTAPQHSIKRAPAPGSLIQRTGATSPDIPLNRRYADLTEGEKAIVRGWYETLKPGDEPPYPERGMRPMVEAMMKFQGRLGFEGELHLDATVGPDGRVSAVKVMRTPDAEMSRLAATVLVDTPFKPALCAGQPCRMDFPVRQVLKRGP